jgi:hypothetical protein
MKIQAKGSSDILSYQTSRRRILEDSKLNVQFPENLNTCGVLAIREGFQAILSCQQCPSKRIRKPVILMAVLSSRGSFKTCITLKQFR